MREIKFRAWDTAAGKMYQDVTGFEGINGFMEGIFLDGTFRSITRSEAIPMQFTGLLDKNGKEIYEGDIVKIDWQDPRYDSIVGVVEWDEQEAAFNFGGGTATEVGWSHEVIGNIHENTELLTK